MTRPACQMPARALMLSWKQQQQDRKDAELMRVYTGLRDVVNARARMMLLSGLAGFQR